MQKEETRFVFFEIRNRMLSEICKDFKIKVDELTFFDFMSGNNIGYEGRRYYCFVHKVIPNIMGTPGELGFARWFAEMILHTKIGNKKAADFIKAHANEIDQHTSYYKVEFEHCDPFSAESCLLIEQFYYKDSDKAHLCGFDERNWVAVWKKDNLETYMPENSRYPLQSFMPKSEDGSALSGLLADGFGDRNGISKDSFLRNVAEGTKITEFQRPNYLKIQPIPYTPAPRLSTLEGYVVYPFGEFKTVKKKDLKKLITAHQGKYTASYTKKVNLVLVGDDIGAAFDAGADNFRSCEYMERAVARKWLGGDVIFVSESDFFAKNDWILAKV